MGRPCQSQTGTEMRIACVDARRGAAVVSGKSQTNRCGRINERLLTRPPAVDGPVVIEMIGQRQIDLPAETIVYCKVRSDFPLVLCIEIVLVGSSINETAAALSVAVWNSQQKVNLSKSGTKVAGASKGIVARVQEGKWVAHSKLAPIITELQGVPPEDISEVVVELVDLVFARLRSILTETQCKETSHRNHGKPRRRGVLWINVETNR